MANPGRTYRIGDTEVVKVEEMVLSGVPAADLYPALSPEEFAAIEPRLAPVDMTSGRDGLIVPIHSWLVRTPEHVILIDTGAGNDNQRPHYPAFHDLHNPFLERLAAAGIRPEDVTHVLHTHLHVDHVGWNTILSDGQWVPTFPNARHLMPSVDRDYYASPESLNEVNIPSEGAYEDSVPPVIAAGMADFVEPEGGVVFGRFTYLPTPGHSKGHMSILLSSGGEEGVFAGDVMHGPTQVMRPDINSVFCEFADDAGTSRRRILEHAADSGALYFGTHFPGSSAGRVTRDGDGYSWSYE